MTTSLLEAVAHYRLYNNPDYFPSSSYDDRMILMRRSIDKAFDEAKEMDANDELKEIYHFRSLADKLLKEVEGYKGERYGEIFGQRVLYVYYKLYDIPK